MQRKNQIELNSGTGAESKAQSAAVREIKASAAKASLKRPAPRRRGDRLSFLLHHMSPAMARNGHIDCVA
jgi:hypothetical protein